MRLEKEYRYIYGIWQYVEMILDELGASTEKIGEFGSESGKLVKNYESKLNDAIIIVEVTYEKKHVPVISNSFGKIAFTSVKIDVNANSSEREKEILDYFLKRLNLYTLRSAG
ncbi:MAG: hypothetical protein QXO71_11850 [Candidatus Jordarchaeaceae archaeon]